MFWQIEFSNKNEEGIILMNYKKWAKVHNVGKINRIWTRLFILLRCFKSLFLRDRWYLRYHLVSFGIHFTTNFKRNLVFHLHQVMFCWCRVDDKILKLIRVYVAPLRLKCSSHLIRFLTFKSIFIMKKNLKGENLIQYKEGYQTKW